MCIQNRANLAGVAKKGEFHSIIHNFGPTLLSCSDLPIISNQQ